MKEKVWLLDSRKHKLVYAEKVRKTDAEWREALTPEQFDITAGKGTERPFTCTFDEIKKPGLYRCVRCGNDLFNTTAKFDSGTGWPSYFSPVSEFNVTFEEDDSLGMRRTEVLCARCDAHLGHVFDDGPPPTGKRYCINSAALEFTED